MSNYLKNACSGLTNFFLLFVLVFSAVAFTTCTKENIQAPWPDAKVYSDANKRIIVHDGDRFIIRFTMEYDRFPIIKEIYDTELITLLDRKINLTNEPDVPPAYSWFLFKALKKGETQITIQHLVHITLQLQNQETFNLLIK